MRLYPALAEDAGVAGAGRAVLVDGSAKDACVLLQGALDEALARARRGEILAMLAIAQFRSGEALRARLTARRVLREFPEGELAFEGKRQEYKDLLFAIDLGPQQRRRVAPRMASPLVELWNEEWAPTSQLGFMFLPQQPAAGSPPVILTLRSTGG